MQAAHWLADMHNCAALEVESARKKNAHLISYAPAFYRLWLDRASNFAREAGGADLEPVMKVVTVGLEIALEHLAGEPTSFLHGEFYASNVLVAQVPGDTGYVLSTGRWQGLVPGCSILQPSAPDGTRTSCELWPIVTTVPAILQPPGISTNSSFCCSVRSTLPGSAMAGWARNWLAPPQHARDWLLEASKLAEEILG